MFYRFMLWKIKKTGFLAGRYLSASRSNESMNPYWNPYCKYWNDRFSTCNKKVLLRSNETKYFSYYLPRRERDHSYDAVIIRFTAPITALTT